MNREVFYSALRKDKRVFGTSLSQAQVKGMEGILDAFSNVGDGSEKTLAYALATGYHETGRRMVPVREGFASTDAGARRAVNALAKKRGLGSAVARYAKPTGPYGHVYYGRGHVQLTWLENYQASSKDAGCDLVKYPDMMLDPVTSARVLIRGLIDGRWNGRKNGIGFYLPPNGKDDLKNARRTVNVLDKWDEIARYYEAFLDAIKAAGGVPNEKPTKQSTQKQETISGTTEHPKAEMQPAAKQDGNSTRNSAIAVLAVASTAAIGNWYDQIITWLGGFMPW